MVSSRFQRTQVYLDPEEHRTLRRLAAERGVSMTTVVREAVGEYLAGRSAEPADGADLVARLREIAELPEPEEPGPEPSPLDAELGASLWEELLEQEAAWEARQAQAES